MSNQKKIFLISELAFIVFLAWGIYLDSSSLVNSSTYNFVSVIVALLGFWNLFYGFYYIYYSVRNKAFGFLAVTIICVWALITILMITAVHDLSTQNLDGVTIETAMRDLAKGI